ncbi:MAG TPA: aldehyde dehydrogenase [Mycobacteriales bacterium]|nr:aldehyde dehydrogenase [Mycobacteriales bacterium]
MTTWDRLHVDGEWQHPVSTETFDVRSPHDGRNVGSAPNGNAADIDRAVAAARRAFDDGPWPRMTVEERCDVLRPFVAAYGERTQQMSDLIIAEMGSPRWFSDLGQANGPWALMSQTLGFADELEWEQRRGGTLVRKAPTGVVGIITPWNVPQVTIAAKLFPALVAGCTVVVKPAPETPLDAMLLAEILAGSGLPAGVVAIVPGGTEAGQRLVTHPDVDKVAFTGSSAVGRWIGAECGRRLARCSLELGGKSAAIICADASIERTVAGLKFSSFLNNGEACVAQTRVLAPRERYDEVVDALAEMTSSLSVGDPEDAETYIGPLVSARHQERVASYLDIGVAEGARVVAGGRGEVEGLSGHYVKPTLFADVDNRMRIAQEEIFGPVVAVIPYDGIDDAVRLANDSDFGLAGSVWTKDREAGLAIARRIRAGTFGINAYAPGFEAPFGGFKASGIGREYGPESLEEYVELQSIQGVPEA